MALTDKLTAIADAIRGKTGKGDALTLDQMPAEIEGIKTEPALEALAVTENGEFLPPDGVDGFSSVAVNVPVPAPVVQPLSVTENGTYEAPEGVDGYNPVTVNVAGSGGDEFEEQFIAAIERDASKPVTKLPEGLTRIGNHAFRACTNLELTSLPSAVTYIDNYAFYECQKLALTELPAGVTYIGSYAFSGCQKLALTELPAGVTYIGSYAFRENMHLFSLTFKGTPETIGTDAFKSCGNLKILNVPWAEGEVSGAPWGTTNATINYNYTGG